MTTGHDGALTATERGDLERLEGAVGAGLARFREAGEALEKIRDARLYRQGHRTFEAYCEARWGMSRRRAYQLIEAAAIVRELKAALPVCTGGTHGFSAPLPANERQARVLAGVPPELRAPAWQGAAALAGPGRAPAPSRMAELLARAAPYAADRARQMAAIVREEEALANEASDELDLEAEADSTLWHVAKGRWHGRQTARHFRDVSVAQDKQALLEIFREHLSRIDGMVVELFGDVEPRS